MSNSRRRHRIHFNSLDNTNKKALRISLICLIITIFLCGITWRPSYINHVKSSEKEWHTKSKCTYRLLNKEYIPKSEEGECWFVLENSKEKVVLEVSKETYLSSNVGDILTFDLAKCDRYNHNHNNPLNVPILYYFLILLFMGCALLFIGAVVFDECSQYDSSVVVVPRRILWVSFGLIVISGITVNILVYV